MVIRKVSSGFTDDFEVHAAVEWDGEGEVGEWVESDARMCTLFARDLRLELTMKQIHHNRLVPLQVVLPSLQQSFLITLNFTNLVKNYE